MKKLNPSLPSDFQLDLIGFLQAKVIGQPEACREIAETVLAAKVGLAPVGRPAGIFLLLGPTGVGKTHVVEQLAEAVHEGLVRKLFKINGGEFSADHEVARILGAPPGYLGHKETSPVFTDQKLNERRSAIFPFTIILIDEVEKSSPALQKLLLGILDRGELTLGDGQLVHFEKTLIFLTSNLGAKELNRLTSASYLAPADTVSSSSAHAGALGAAKRYFSPEFFNRLDKTITFRHLEQEELRQVARLEIQRVEELVKGRGGHLPLVPSADALDWLVAQGFDKNYGARHLKRAISQHVTIPLSRLLASRQIPNVKLWEERIGIGLASGPDPKLEFFLLEEGERFPTVARKRKVVSEITASGA